MGAAQVNLLQALSGVAQQGFPERVSQARTF
jgi:hypothetical protein